MKCVCPMGGDRTCPDDCPLAVWANLPEPDRKAQRKPIAEKLYKLGFTMEAIAIQLGVSKVTISTDLKDIVKPLNNVEDRGKDKLGRKKSTGRPKGSGSTISGRRRIKELTPEVERKVASAALDQNKSLKTAADEAGVGSVQQAKIAVAYERGRREMLTELLDAAAAANFSEKGKLKIEDAIRIHKTRLDKQFQQRVNEEVRRRIDAADDATRKHYKELLQENITLQRMVGHRGVFTKTQFRQMQMLCHPDNSASPQLRAELSQILVENEKKIVKFEK